MTGIAEVVSCLESQGGVTRVSQQVRKELEVASILSRSAGDAAVVFDQVRDTNARIVGNLCSSKRRLAQALSVEENSLYDLFAQSMASPLAPSTMSSYDGSMTRVCQGLKDLPILTHFAGDPGPYITAGIVSVIEPGSGIENVSIHRMLVIDDNHLAIRIVPRHLYRITQMFAQRGERTVNVGIAIGVHPAILLAASSPAPFGVSEYSVANAFMKGELELVRCDNGVRVPLESEIVLEGQILLDRNADEGPFVDLTGTYDVVRKQPVVEVNNVLVRNNYVYQALLPGGMEHKLLMGFPYEARIWSALRTTIPGVKAVSLTSGGCGWLHAVVAIDKQTEGDGKNALLAAFGAHPSLKHAVVVDDDINVRDAEDVEWAIATRFRADKDLLVINNVRGSSLDPSADQETLIGAKMGLDATRTLSKPKQKFERVKPASQ